MTTYASARASREVSVLAETSTIRAAPFASTWESWPAASSAMAAAPHKSFQRIGNAVGHAANSEAARHPEPMVHARVGDDDAYSCAGQEREERLTPPALFEAL